MNLPESYLSSMKEQLNTTDFDAYLASFEEEGFHGIRLNPLKAPSEKAEELLSLVGLDAPEPVTWSGGFGYYDTLKESAARHPFYYGGLYYLQEPSAMAPAAILPIEEGDYVLDLCAAPGGKSTLLGARLNRTGFLLSNDISSSRAKSLLKNIEMAGIGNVCVSSENPEILVKTFPAFFDKILIDAPCSGEGMFRREPSMVKSWMEKGPEFYSEIQKTLLLQAASMLKPGGMILYSTCTFSEKEDEENIRWILQEREDMESVPIPSFEGFTYDEVLGSSKLYPFKLHGEGHFAAMLKKKGNAEAAPFVSPVNHEKLNGKFLKKNPALEEFLKLVNRNLAEEGLFWEKNGQVYLLPVSREVLGNVRYLRTGLLLGELKKDRFEPSQALAMALRKEEFKNIVDYSVQDQTVIRYLKGETILTDGAEVTGKDGWCLVCCHGYPLGFAKRNKSQLKNKYYPGWRWQ